MNSNYWNKVYESKNEDEVSWFQSEPKKSLELIDELQLAPNARVIDIGGGDSKLTDFLLNRGFSDISVLDISSVSLQKLKFRLGKKANAVEFITSDVTTFIPMKKYDLWHDRATFHFLTSVEDMEAYLKVAFDALNPGGYLIISTFSKSGPEKCSGLEICQYSQDELKALFGKYFMNTKCLEDTHVTPWGSTQNFVYCGFKKI